MKYITRNVKRTDATEQLLQAADLLDRAIDRVDAAVVAAELEDTALREQMQAAYRHLLFLVSYLGEKS